jgi:hypothetical protein
MSHQAGRLVGAGVLLSAVFLAAPSAATVSGPASSTFEGAFEFEGVASRKVGSGCRGVGQFGKAKAGARVLISERSADGDFQPLGRGRLDKGKIVEATTGDKVCRMTFRVRAGAAPAADSAVYLEVKGVVFDLRWPAADVTDGDLGTWRCEFSDDSCALIVGNA